MPGRPSKIWITVGREPTALAAGAGGSCLDIFLSSIISLFFLPLRETARYRLKYCLKGPLNPKQPTNPLGRLKTDYQNIAMLFDTRTGYCKAPQCSLLRRKFMECSINSPALSLLMKHLVIGQRLKTHNFSAFHCSPRGSLVSIGQHFVATRVVHLPKSTETS